MAPPLQLDKIDLKILHTLQQHGRLSNVELAERVALSPSPCLRRLKALEETGTIRTYTALLNPTAIGLGLQVFIRVSVDKSRHLREGFCHTVQHWPQVLGCFALSGETDYLLHAFFTDMQTFSHFMLETLLAHPGVLDARSSFVLHEVKNATDLPLLHLPSAE